jgi:hypothetical protein
VLVVTIGSGSEKPYALTSGEIYVREDGSTTVANRDQIVNMVKSAIGTRPTGAIAEDSKAAKEVSRTQITVSENGTAPKTEDGPMPRTGVEIVSSEQRDGTVYHTMRDLRNHKIVENVTHDSARRLWRYAIKQRESGEPTVESITWDGSLGVVRVQKQRNGTYRYDLAYRENGTMHVFYGVTETGMPEEWKNVVEQAQASSATAS